MTIEGTYLVRSRSQLRTVEDVDHTGVRIAVGAGAAYDLYLTRTLTKAELRRAPTSAGAIDLFITEGLEAAAGVRQSLAEYARTHPETRVIEGKFMSIEQAMAIPKGRPAGSAYLQTFIENILLRKNKLSGNNCTT
jgi:polar amino acid transport system substrate-binding protein